MKQNTDSIVLGRVVSQNRLIYHVWLENKEKIGRISGKLQYEIVSQEDYPVVGDWVTCKNNDDEVIIMEAKASVGDLKNDRKLLNYIDYCDKLYIVSNSYPVCKEALELDNRIGVIMLNSTYNFKEVMREATPINNGDRSLIMDINKKNSRRFIFGY